MSPHRLAPSLALLAVACAAPGGSVPTPPLAGAEPADHLIEEGEEHFAHLWKLTAGGENAEGYWSFAHDRLVYQHTDRDGDIPCDRIFIIDRDGTKRQISSGIGRTTCGYFLPGDERIIYGSTEAHMRDCPPPLDYSQGYVWPVHPEYDLWVTDLTTGKHEQLTFGWGYDAEATVSPLGDRMVFTSTRSGDLELWTCDLDGSNLFQVTDTLGYDGGAFFSHDGQKLVFRATVFTPGAEEEERADYRRRLAEWTVRPMRMELFLIDADGKNRRQLTRLGGASFAPYFFPDDQRVLFASNHEDPRGYSFDLFAIGVDGEGLEKITTYEGFDAFPMFDATGEWLVFASNRGGSRPGETNLFLARWRD